MYFKRVIDILLLHLVFSNSFRSWSKYPVSIDTPRCRASGLERSSPMSPTFLLL